MSRDFTRYVPKIGVDLMLTGDHRHHLTMEPSGDVPMSWDDTSQVLTLYLDEYQAKDLFWDLLELIPQLRHDRR